MNTGSASGNARVYLGTIVGRTSDEPAPASDVLYSARIDASYGESLGVSNVYPAGGRYLAPSAWNNFNVIPCKVGDMCLIVVSGGAPRLWVGTEYLHILTCDEASQ